MKAYIKIDAKNELPDKPGVYHSEYIDSLETICFDTHYFDGEKFEEKTDYWLSEISLIDLFIEYDICKNINEAENQCSILDSFEIIEKFLTQKGIVIKD